MANIQQDHFVKHVNNSAHWNDFDSMRSESSSISWSHFSLAAICVLVVEYFDFIFRSVRSSLIAVCRGAKRVFPETICCESHLVVFAPLHNRHDYCFGQFDFR